MSKPAQARPFVDRLSSANGSLRTLSRLPPSRIATTTFRNRDIFLSANGVPLYP